MTENKRYKVAIYDEKAIRGYCVLDLENPSQTARLKYNNVFISTKEGCNIVCDLLNEKEERIQELEDKLENWKQLATVAQSENSILHNELGIAIEQGYALSDAFKEYQKRRG